MKFDKYDCWKHKNCMDVFFFVNAAYATDLTEVILVGHWMVQGMEHHWMGSSQDRFVVRKDEYENWNPYEPTGEYL